MVAASLAAGCAKVPEPLPEREAYGWLSAVVVQPEELAALLEGSREGWVALHRHDYAAARTHLLGEERARASLALAIVHGDLARLSGQVHADLFAAWEATPGGLASDDAPAIAMLAAHCAGTPTEATRWAGRVARDHPAAPIADAISGAGDPFAVPDTPLSERMALHGRASTGDMGPLVTASLEPLLRTTAGDFERASWDPCVHRSLALGWEATAGQELGGAGWKAAASWAQAGLGGALFAPWLVAADLPAEVERATSPGTVGAQAPGHRALGLPSGAPFDDDVQAARDEVRVADAVLDGWRSHLLASADREGQAVVRDLQIVERFRQEWLLTRAREALRAGRPRRAGALLERARDASSGGVGATNAPALFALLAEADSRQGRTREALDALHELSAALPEVRGLQEALGDLAVLRGLDRHGVSKEN